MFLFLENSNTFFLRTVDEKITNLPDSMPILTNPFTKFLKI